MGLFDIFDVYEILTTILSTLVFIKGIPLKITIIDILDTFLIFGRQLLDSEGIYQCVCIHIQCSKESGHNKVH